MMLSGSFTTLALVGLAAAKVKFLVCQHLNQEKKRNTDTQLRE